MLNKNLLNKIEQQQVNKQIDNMFFACNPIKWGVEDVFYSVFNDLNGVILLFLSEINY